MCIQGVPIENCQKSKAVDLKRSTFDPMFVKPKWVLEAVDFFQFSIICLQFSAVCLQFFKKSTTSQTHFGFTNIGSKEYRFSSKAIDF